MGSTSRGPTDPDAQDREKLSSDIATEARIAVDLIHPAGSNGSHDFVGSRISFRAKWHRVRISLSQPQPAGQKDSSPGTVIGHYR